MNLVMHLQVEHINQDMILQVEGSDTSGPFY